MDGDGYSCSIEPPRDGSLDGYETVALAEVPPVLLVETLAEIDQIAAAGEGIVEDWEKRVGW